MNIRLLGVAVAMACALPSFAHADVVVVTPTVGANFAGIVQSAYDTGTGAFSSATGFVGGLQNPGLPRSPGERDGHDRSAIGNCVMRVDTTEGNNVALVVRGTGMASGSPRAVATEVQCRILNEAGTVVFDLTRAEVGATVVLAGVTVIRNDGPYTVCARADAKFDNGQDVYWPFTNDDPTAMACATP